MSTVDSKLDSHQLFVHGHFGNTVRTWESMPELAASGYQGKVTIRYKGGLGGRGPTVYAVPRIKVHPVLCAMVRDGWNPKQIYFNEAMPDDKIVVQGELCSGDWRDPEWLFRGSTELGHMHDVLKRAQVWRGWRAKELLRTKMDPSSWEDLQCLIDLYPEAIIELSVFSVCYGATPNRNTVIWEVRNY